VLARVGTGVRYAQVRRAPARLTHCMRWLGAARRAHDIAADYARRRTAFGKPLGEHEGVGFMLADNEMDIHQSRLVIWHAAWVLDRGEHGTHESSMAKVICSEAIWRVDRSMQILGGLGITGDTIVARLFRDVRPFRIYDGPPRCTRSPGGCCGRAGQEHDGDRREQPMDAPSAICRFCGVMSRNFGGTGLEIRLDPSRAISPRADRWLCSRP
jgi:hypothetical protein